MNMRDMGPLKALGVAVMLWMMTGCSTTYEKPLVTRYWPPPPETPRVKFVDYYYSTDDVTLKKSMFGEALPDLFSKPYGVAVMENGEVICVTDLDRLILIYPQEHRYVLVREDVSWPFGATFTSEGNLYVTDMGQKDIRIFDKEGKYLRAFGKGVGLSKPTGIAVDEKRGRVYVVDAGAMTVKVFDMEGGYLYDLGKGKGSELGQFGFPSNIAVNTEGQVYVVDSMNFRVEVFNPEGEAQFAFGELGDTPGSFARPKGIAIDQRGYVYVVDAAFRNVQVFEDSGQLLGWFAEGGDVRGLFNLPAGVAVDFLNRIYVVDQVNPKLNIYQFLPDDYWSRFPEEKMAAESMGHRFEAPPSEHKPQVSEESVEAQEPIVEPEVSGQPEEVGKEEAAPPPPEAGRPSTKKEAELLYQMLEIRFGSAAAEYRNRVMSADPPTVQKWGTRILSAQEIGDVFEE